MLRLCSAALLESIVYPKQLPNEPKKNFRDGISRVFCPTALPQFSTHHLSMLNPCAVHPSSGHHLSEYALVKFRAHLLGTNPVVVYTDPTLRWTAIYLPHLSSRGGVKIDSLLTPDRAIYMIICRNPHVGLVAPFALHATISLQN